jgi:hypothetical protein
MVKAYLYVRYQLQHLIDVHLSYSWNFNFVIAGCFVYLCDFHREQSWVRWVSATKNGETQLKDEVLSILRRAAPCLHSWKVPGSYQGHERELNLETTWSSSEMVLQPVGTSPQGESWCLANINLLIRLLVNINLLIRLQYYWYPAWFQCCITIDL